MFLYRSGVVVFVLITFDKLKIDYKDLIKQCKTLNLLILLEFVTYSFINVLFVISDQWLTIFFNIPLMDDPSTIMNTQILSLT
ncbi:unnamed protein product [Rotaria sp. Silwood1]|nr:unnamed protein product [Rotaria sp. Silwood1]CAF4585189.1 unnamed protein product [Rotaria sp. Silwood1]